MASWTHKKDETSRDVCSDFSEKVEGEKMESDTCEMIMADWFDGLSDP